MIIAIKKYVNIKQVVLMFFIILLLSPLITYMFVNFRIKSCGKESIDESDTNIYILQTYKWEYGKYIMSVSRNSNIDLEEDKSADIIYIKTLLGNNFENKLLKNITDTSETGILQNIYRIEGSLIPTNEKYRNVPIYNLYVDDWWLLKEIQRDSILGEFLPNYYLTVLDFKLFSNILSNLIIIFVIALIINNALIYMTFHNIKIKTSIWKYLFNFMLSIVVILLTVFLFIGIVYLYSHSTYF